MGKQKTKCTSSKGITLIALVITIIVLLILAGVSINMVVGENGILGKAQSAVLENKKGKILEEAQMLISEWQTDYFVNKVPLDGRSGQTESGADVICTAGQIFVTDNSSEGKLYAATYSNEAGLGSFVDVAQDTTSQMYKATHPEEHMPANTGWEYVTGTWSTGYVIKETSTGDEFVWIPVVSSESYVKKSGSKNWRMKSDSLGEDGIIDVENDILGDNIGLTNILETNIANGAETTKPAPEAIIVNNAGGFWVSRYEIGIDNTTKDTTETAVVQSGWTKDTIKSQQCLEPVRNITQTKALELANTWKTGEDVQSGLITGTQWDVMCGFVGWSMCDVDCTSWGNFYNNQSASYTDGFVWHSDTGSLNYRGWSNGETQKGIGIREVFATGMFKSKSNVNTVKKNIYDVAGNVWEWTTEVSQYSSGNRVIRGNSVRI